MVSTRGSTLKGVGATPADVRFVPIADIALDQGFAAHTPM